MTNDMYDKQYVLSLDPNNTDDLKKYKKIMNQMEMCRARDELIIHQRWLKGISNRLPTYLIGTVVSTQDINKYGI